MQGYQGDGHGTLVGRRSNELLVTVALRGNPTSLSAASFTVRAMTPNVLPATVVGVHDYGDGATGLLLAQHRYVIWGRPDPANTWPDGPMLFQVHAQLRYPGTWISGTALATALISDADVIEERVETNHLLFGLAQVDPST